MTERSDGKVVAFFPYSAITVAFAWVLSLFVITLSVLFLATNHFESWQLPFIFFVTSASTGIIVICAYQLIRDFRQSSHCAATLSDYLQMQLSRRLRERLGYKTAVISVTRSFCAILAWRSCLIYFGPLICLAFGVFMIQQKTLHGFYPSELPAITLLSLPLWSITVVATCVMILLYAVIVPHYLKLIHAWSTSVLVDSNRDLLADEEIGSHESELGTSKAAADDFVSGKSSAVSRLDYAEGHAEESVREQRASGMETASVRGDSGSDKREKIQHESANDDLFDWDD